MKKENSSLSAIQALNNNEVNLSAEDNDNLSEIIKNHKKFRELEEKINKSTKKWTDKSFLLIQGRINALMELIARDELSYINEVKDPKKILENKLFNDQRFTLIKLNIDLLSKVVKSDEETTQNIDIQKLLEGFKF